MHSSDKIHWKKSDIIEINNVPLQLGERVTLIHLVSSEIFVLFNANVFIVQPFLSLQFVCLLVVLVVF